MPAYSEYSNFLSKAGIGNSSAGSIKIRGKPYNFPYAGYVGSGSLSNGGSQGNYWSSTATGSLDAYRLYFASDNVYTRSYNRFNGYSIRCIAP